MKTLIFNGTEHFVAERIVKRGNEIVGYIGGQEVFAFRGIKDWSMYKLADGQEFDGDAEQERERRLADLEAAVAWILGGVVQ